MSIELKRKCKEDNCENNSFGRGLCKKHYARLLRNGSTKLVSIEEKLLSRVIKDFNDCWKYTAYLNSRGYGRLRYKGKKVLAHRLSYLLFKGEIKDKLRVCHTCDNPTCINPDHLFLGTDKDNNDDAIKKGRINPSLRAKNRWEICPSLRKSK